MIHPLEDTYMLRAVCNFVSFPDLGCGKCHLKCQTVQMSFPDHTFFEQANTKRLLCTNMRMV